MVTYFFHHESLNLMIGQNNWLWFLDIILPRFTGFVWLTSVLFSLLNFVLKPKVHPKYGFWLSAKYQKFFGFEFYLSVNCKLTINQNISYQNRQCRFTSRESIDSASPSILLLWVSIKFRTVVCSSYLRPSRCVADPISPVIITGRLAVVALLKIHYVSPIYQYRKALSSVLYIIVDGFISFAFFISFFVDGQLWCLPCGIGILYTWCFLILLILLQFLLIP